MWDVVFQPFWISGKSGHESFRETSVERDGGVLSCFFGSFFFAVAAGVPEGQRRYISFRHDAAAHFSACGPVARRLMHSYWMLA